MGFLAKKQGLARDTEPSQLAMSIGLNRANGWQSWNPAQFLAHFIIQE